MPADVLTIDAHHHLWDPAARSYPWLAAAAPEINRAFSFEDLAPILQRQHVDGTVLVQAADTDADTDAMFAVAAAHPEVLGVVGYVPLERPEQAAERLSVLRQRPRFAGIRNLIHDQPDPEWLRRPDVGDGLRLLEESDVPFDLVTSLPRHLEQAAYLSGRFPDLRLVIDHLGKPPIKAGGASRWRAAIRQAAGNPRVFAKVSGLYPAVGDWRDHGPQDLRPCVDDALEAFGPDRLMMGSDWPVSVLAGGYAVVWQTLLEVLTGYGPEVAEPILGRTARTFYRLE